MKKYFSFFILTLVAMMSQAADVFVVDKVDIKVGEEKTIPVSLTNEQETQGVNIDIYLPEGLSFVGTDAGVVFADRTSGFAQKSKKIQKSGALRVSMTFGEMEAGTGQLFTFKVKAAENASLGVVKLSYKEQKITYGSTTSKLSDMESDVNIYQTYKVTVVANDANMGTVSGGNDEAMSGTPMTITATPNTGYDFVAWMEGETQVSTDAAYTFTPTKDITLKATFKAHVYKATFKSEGKSEDKEIAFGATVEAPTPGAKTGYTFSGWDNLPETMPAQDITINALYTINQYTMTFKLANGEADVVKKQDYDSELTAPADFTKTGYTFTGWDAEIPAKIPTEDKTFTAQWKINQYTITFKLGNGEDDVVKKQDYDTALETPTPTRTGYTFKGWDETVPSKIPAADKTFTAQWEINQYTMTFKLANGEADVVKKQDYDSELTAPADFTKTGYTFTGWDAEIPAKIPAEDKTFTAQWKINQYTVKFVADGTDVYNQKQDYNSAITAPEAPTKEGHTFKEWTPEVAATVPAEDVTYTAVYTVNMYKVFYKVDDADYKTVEVKYGEEIPSESAPEKEGYTFSGWSEAPATMPANDVTITGSFAINQYKVKFVIGEEVISEQTLDYGTTINAPEAPLKEGYTFAGWGEVAATVPAKDVTYTGSYTVNTYKVFYKVDDADYKTVEVKYGEEIPSESAPEKEGYTFSGWSEAPATMPASDVTITGSFAINQYKVKFVIGEEVISEQTLDYGSPINAPEAPLKEGYTFAGWGEVAATVPAKDVTYTGSYTVNVYVIRYYVNGELVAEDKVEYGAPVVLRGYEPEDPNRYTFIGWIGETFETMPAHDLEYQADISDGISAVSNDGTLQPVYRMDGSRVNARNLRNLPAGAYIIGGKKVIKK